MTKLELQTRDGSCPSYLFQPPGKGPWPGVLVFMDGIGIRPAMLEVGERIAAHGYFVLLPDRYYRSGPHATMDPQTVFADPEQRKLLFEKFMGPASTANIMSDTRTFLDLLAQRAEVRRGGIGITGYFARARHGCPGDGRRAARLEQSAARQRALCSGEELQERDVGQPGCSGSLSCAPGAWKLTGATRPRARAERYSAIGTSRAPRRASCSE